jgi:hypothetical protein
MFWDDLIRRWRRDAGGMSPRLLRAAAGHVAFLPAPRPRRRLRITWLLLFQSGQVQAIPTAVSA